MEIQIVAQFPAYQIVKFEAPFGADDEFAIGYDAGRHGQLFNFYKLGCVADYAAKYGEDPVAAVEGAKANGHEIYWANPKGAMIHDGPKVQKVVRGVEIGDVIEFKGKKFRIEKVPFDRVNIKLVEV